VANPVKSLRTGWPLNHPPRGLTAEVVLLNFSSLVVQ
jgi:hypothetical protein